MLIFFFLETRKKERAQEGVGTLVDLRCSGTNPIVRVLLKKEQMVYRRPQKIVVASNQGRDVEKSLQQVR